MSTSRFRAVPISRADAQRFILMHHRHHQPSVGDVFRVALALDEEIVAVAMVGRPVARMLCDGVTAEVTRLCILDRPDTQHAASALYARCWRIAREMGYSRLLTYTLADETGVSLVAAGWRVVHHVRGRSWDTPSRHRVDTHPTCDKTLWETMPLMTSSNAAATWDAERAWQRDELERRMLALFEESESL